MLQIDTQYLQRVLVDLLNTPSPVGDTEAGITLCCDILKEFPTLDLHVTRKGALIANWPGERSDAPRGVTAHIDTLGAVVKQIKPNGRLQLAQLGNYAWTAIENEGVTVVASSGAKYRGTVLVTNASHHLYSSGDGPNDKPRNERTVEVRLDARTSTRSEAQALGIEVGDFVLFDPRVEVVNGFIRSRHLDDKGCVAALFAALKAIHDADKVPAQRTTLLIANYEEVGHGGASGFPPDLHEVLALDIAPLGDEQNADEFSCALCARDDDGPYDMRMRRHLISLARQHDIALKTDVFNYYCSDGDALWKAGADVRCSLIGPGVDATHGYERTHMDALVATAQMIVAYLLSESA
jgi:putative aminopeptidase FrvX